MSLSREVSQLLIWGRRRPVHKAIAPCASRERAREGSTTIDYTSQHWIEPFATGKIRQNIKFVDFWCVFLTKIKVDPESWCKKLSIKQLRKKKILKDDFT